MPTLRDTEWRLLCLIVRQTLGWQDKNGGRKARDWMTHRQLQRHTGRASEAVCNALDSLVRRGLVEVQDEMGQPLLTPGVRRHYGGKLFFRLGAGASGKEASSLGTTPQKRKGAEKERAAFSEANLTKSEKPFSENEIRKTKTTKETETKEKESVLQNRNDENEKGAMATPANRETQQEPAQQSLPLDAGEEALQFIACYRERYCQRFPQRLPPSVSAEEVEELEKALATHSAEELRTLLETFFDCRWNHVVRRRHELGAFTSSLHILRLIPPKTPIQFRRNQGS